MVRPFKFLNFWTMHPGFIKVVEENWKVNFKGSPFVEFQAKMKQVKQALAKWSKETFGDIFQKIKSLEEEIRLKEIQLEIHPSKQNTEELSKAEAELKKFRYMEEEFLKQKAGMRWFKDGDRNTRFFHNYVKERRKKLYISDIIIAQGAFVTTSNNIRAEAVLFFEEQFKETDREENDDMLDVIPKIITPEQNGEIEKIPTMEEVRGIVLALNGDSTSGPDGFSGEFFQKCWKIIGEDITNMVKAFFCGQQLPRFITHTNVVLLPKKENVNKFSDLRPVSLSTFANKIISRLIHQRITKFLPGIISRNQTGFVKGRSITENVLLAHENIRDINIRKKHQNVVVKLDMAKACDRVSWVFLIKVLRKFGFSEFLKDMVWRLISNNWYSILVNGKSYGFFKSSRGLKQGDPLVQGTRCQLKR